MLPTCSRCGSLEQGMKECKICAKIKTESCRGKFSSRKHLCVKEENFQVFWDLCKKKLADFKLHLFKFRMLSKSNVVDVKRKCLQPRDVAINHDFTEALTLEKNEAVQSNHLVAM